MSLNHLYNEAIDWAWPDCPTRENIPTKLWDAILAAFWIDQVPDGDKESHAQDAWERLPPKYRELIIENALTKCIDKYDFEWQLHFAVESILQDEILGQIEDHFRDYCESNGVVHPGYEYDELCVEERG